MNSEGPDLLRLCERAFETFPGKARIYPSQRENTSPRAPLPGDCVPSPRLRFSDRVRHINSSRKINIIDGKSSLKAYVRKPGLPQPSLSLNHLLCPQSGGPQGARPR